MQNDVDDNTQIPHNDKQDDENVEIIRLDDKTPLNDPNCEHNLVKDPTDEMGDYVAWVCDKCNVGFFLPKTKK